MVTAPAADRILTVTEITRSIKGMLDDAFPAVWVRGEITGLTRPASGHVYFSLKDGQAVLDCALFSRAAGRVSFEPRNGVEVEAFGNVSVYETRGRYQLYVEELRMAGMGARLLALEELKRRLQAEGLFDPARKRPLPRYPRRIGLVTSPTGAAVRDLTKVLQSRWPSIALVLAPVKVQGEGAAAEIAAAIERFNRYGRVELLIVGRGGGSIEDLWAFNEETVVRAIAASAIPVISAVGHEVDVTLADLVADVRAATPSNAGEIAVRDRREVEQRVATLRGRLERSMTHALANRRQRLDHLLAKYRFRRQREILAIWRRDLDAWAERVARAAGQRLARARARLAVARDAYGLREWPRVLADRREVVNALVGGLAAASASAIEAWRRRLAGYEDRLRALSPRQVMERGYCLVRGPDGRLRRSVETLAVGDLLRVEFARGEADARVEVVRAGEDHGE